MDLTREADREALRAHLGGLYAGRPVLVGPGVLAGFLNTVGMLQQAGAGPILVLSTARGAGEVPDVEVVEVTPPETTSVTAELRALDPLVRDLPADVVARIEAFDPDRRGIWSTPPFISTDEPILGRPVTGGRPAVVRRPRGQDLGRGAVGDRGHPAGDESRRTPDARSARRGQRRARRRRRLVRVTPARASTAAATTSAG